MQNKVLVSIVIPVWNAKDFLMRCLNSIINQSLNQVEIICVNDASSDDSLAILQEYAFIDKRIQIIDLPKNSGESAARNVGLARAKGEYIAFVDNDDEIDLNFYEKVYALAKETGADIAKGTRMNYELDQRVREHNINTHIAKNKVYFTSQWWTALYRRSLIIDNNIRCPEGYPLNGDAVFLTKAVISANKVATTNDVYYHYHRRADSGNAMILSVGKVISVIETTKIILSYINEKKDLLQNVEYDYLYYLHTERIIRNVLRKANWENQEKDVKQLAAQTIIEYFHTCLRKNSLERTFAARLGKFYRAVADRNVNALTETLISSAGVHALNAQILRNRLAQPAFVEDDWELAP